MKTIASLLAEKKLRVLVHLVKKGLVGGSVTFKVKMLIKRNKSL
jgi:hypothetical protein